MMSARMDVFGGAVWAGHGPALRPPTPAKAQETVLNALLEDPWTQEHRKRLDWTVSLMIHVVIVSALVILPMCFTQVIDLQKFQAMVLVAPPPPAPAPPPAAVVRARVLHRPIIAAKLIAPTVIPRKVLVVHEPEAAPEISGVIGGIAGDDGVLGKIIGGTEGTRVSAIAPPPPVKKEKEILRVGGVVKPPRQIYAPPPQYPALAKAANVQGTVVIEAVIDERGNVTNVRAIAGPGLLIPEALRTVMTWKYEPTYLDGDPTPVRMEVTVHFSMR